MAVKKKKLYSAKSDKVKERADEMGSIINSVKTIRSKNE
jgi:hypothetical protein